MFESNESEPTDSWDERCRMSLLNWINRSNAVKANLESDDEEVIDLTDPKEATRTQKAKTLQDIISDKKPTKQAGVQEKLEKAPEIKVEESSSAESSSDSQKDDDRKKVLAKPSNSASSKKVTPEPLNNKKKSLTQPSKSAQSKKMTPKSLTQPSKSTSSKEVTPELLESKKNVVADSSANLPSVKKSTPKATPKTTSSASKDRRTNKCMDCSTPIYPKSKRCKECYSAFVKSTSKSPSVSVVEETPVNRLSKEHKPLVAPEKETVSSGKLKLTIKRSAIGDGGKLEPPAKKKRTMKEPIGKESKL